MKKLIYILFFFIVIIPFPENCKAQQADSLKTKKIYDMSIEELLNVKIFSSGKQEERVGETPASIVIITRNEIESYGFKTISEILENVPGMYLINDYIWTGSDNFGTRGFFSTGAFAHMVVLINGINQKTELLFDSYPIEKISLPVEAIDRIEIIRGPAGVVYGSGAFFGAINIITNDIQKGSTNTFVSASAGNYGSNDVFIGLRGEHTNIKYSINGGYFKDAGIDEPFSKMMTDASVVTKPLEEQGWNLDKDRTEGLLKTNRKYFNLSLQSGNFDLNGGWVKSRKGVIETIASRGEGSIVSYLNSYASLGYKKRISEKFSFNSKIGYFNDNHYVDNNYYYDFGYTNNIARSGVYELEINSFININPKNSMAIGFSRRTVDDIYILADYPLFGTPDLEFKISEMTVMSLFFQMNSYLTQKLQFVGGIRLDNTRPYTIISALTEPEPTMSVPLPPTFLTNEKISPEKEYEFTPRLAFIYSPTENHVLKMLYGRAIKQPTAVQYWDAMFSGAPSLVPSRITTMELSYLGIISSSFSGSFSFFHTFLDKLISRTNILTSEGSILLSTNAGKVNTYGIESGIKVQLPEFLKLDIDITYQKTRNERKGFENICPGYSPKLLGYGKAVFDVSKDFSIGLTGRYVGEMESGWNLDNLDAAGMPVFDQNDPLKGRLGYKVDDYFIFSANFRIGNFYREGLFLNFKFNNLLNTEIYYPATTSNPLFDIGTLGRGRSFTVTFGMKK